MIRIGSQDLTIEVADGDSFEDSVRDGTADPYTGIRIRSGDSYLYGGEDRWPKNWITYFANSLLEIVPDIVNGGRAVITNHNGPSYFVFEPGTGDRVEITHAFSRDAVDDPEERSTELPTAIVALSDFTETIVAFGKSYRERLLSINPSLESREDIQLLSTNIEEAELILSKMDFDS